MRITPGSDLAPDAAPADDAHAAEERWVRCAPCEARLAREDARFAVNGSSEHEFMNPAGIRFVVLCFASAPGCTPEGAASHVWSWFPGRAWRVALCGRCRTHVGWSFESPGSAPFFALIRTQLR